MSETLSRPPAAVTDLLQVRPQHLRAVEIARDYSDPAAMRGYVVTPYLRATFERIVEALRPGSTARAWRLTGDYGSGKSSFALALARFAAGQETHLPQALRVPGERVRLAPVLVVGEREPLGRSVLNGLRASVEREFTTPPKALARRLKAVDETSGPDVAAAAEAVALVLRETGRADGLLIVLDELGKNLEHAARAPAEGDLQLLQNLADAAPRSGSTPIVVVGLLHQAVTAYADQLASVDRREWEKVSGRYEEVLFAPPIEQAATLVASALGLDLSRTPPALQDGARRQMRTAVDAGWYGPGAPSEALEGLAPALSVLDPFVLPVLARVLRRYGQNERSLFSFLISVEPHGLMSHARRPVSEFTPYRLHNLFDYVAANLPSALESGPSGTRWGVIRGVLDTAPCANETERQALKAVALLNLLDDPGFALTPELLVETLADAKSSDRKSAQAAVRRVIDETRILYDRGAGGGLCLWPHTSVDIDAAFQDALATADPGQGLVTVLREVLGREPLVARRHYIEKGALRHFEVVYAGHGELPKALSAPIDPRRVDGRVIIALPVTPGERAHALEILDGFDGWSDTLLVGVPEPVAPLSPLLRDLRAWQAVRDGTPALAGDRYAREEVSRQLAFAEERLRRALGAFLDLKGGGAIATHWRHRGETLDIRSGRELTETLSRLCDHAYRKAPIIRNELINRRQLSSAAARARTLLVEGLSQAADKPGLGLDTEHTPPERSIYLSVLQPGGVHVQEDGRWKVAMPPPEGDKLNLRPSLEELGRVLRQTPDRKVPFEELLDALRPAPFGVRDGVIPLLIAIYLAVHWHHTAVYEDGTYLEQVGGPEFARMLKEPEHFTVQHCAVEGVRADVFSRLARALGLKADAEDPDLLDVVRPLLQFVARLSDNARRTQRVSAAAAAVRAVLLRVTDPSALLFQDLPRACGIEPFDPAGAPDEARLNTFLIAVSGAVRELRDAYPALLARTAAAVGNALDAGEQLEDVRAGASRRAGRLVKTVVEPELRTFLLRLTDTGLADTPWLESLASFLARKPPDRWTDSDERDALHRLKLLARRFTRVEEALLEEEKKLATEPGRTAYRLVLTGADGVEQTAFVVGAMDPAEPLTDEFAKLLAAHGPTGLVAAARALAAAVANLQTEDPPEGSKP